jgi:hypothetical protein
MLHMEEDKKRDAGDPAHKPPFGDLWSLMASTSIARRSRGYAVRQMSTPRRGGGKRKMRTRSWDQESPADDCVNTCQNTRKSKSRSNSTHRIVTPTLQTAATAFGANEHLNPALLADGHLADLRHTSSVPLTREIPLQVFWEQGAG